MAEELTFRLEDFEGPLELLLTLVQKHKMDLHNIPILELIDQYTAAVASADDADPETASAFIEMAAHLVEMKSYLLLPRSEEGERMKQEFTGQLIEYDQCRRMAALLRAKGEQAPVFVRQPMEMEWDNTYTLHHAPQILADYWNALAGRTRLRREPTQQQFEPLVTAPMVSVTSRVVYILRRMLGGEEGDEVFASTFHSACVRILRRWAEEIGYPRSFTIYDTDDSKRVVKDCLKELELDEKTFPVREILSVISRAKDEMLLPEDFRAYWEKNNDWRKTRIAKVYSLYTKKLRDANALDFDDIILLTVQLLQSALALSDETGGAFDITIAPLVTAWGITSDTPRVPSQEEIESLLKAAIGYGTIADLWVNPDCGLKTRDYEETKQSLRHLVDATKAIRASL